MLLRPGSALFNIKRQCLSCEPRVDVYVWVQVVVLWLWWVQQPCVHPEQHQELEGLSRMAGTAVEGP